MILSALLLFAASSAWAAPCCSSQSAVPTLMTGDERFLVGATTLGTTIVADAPAGSLPVFWDGTSQDWTASMELDLAALISDRWQAGLAVPVAFRAINEPGLSESGWGLGDLKASIAFEALPEWEYSAWKPKGYVFSQLSIPSGKSIYASTRISGLDAFGRGSWGAMLGAALVKRWSRWDAFAVPALEVLFPGPVSNTVVLGAQAGASFAVGGGVSFGALRIGARMQPVWGSRRSFVNAGISGVSADQLVWNASIALSWLLGDEWGLGLAYNDQTLFGPVNNTALSRGVSLSVQRRWLR